MLPRAHRMVDPADFRTTSRQGARAGTPLVVVHCRTDEDPHGCLVGFVVPKREIKRATGRNRVKRQLRHLMRDRLHQLPGGTHLVIRAHAAALDASHEDLEQHLDSALGRALRKLHTRQGTATAAASANKDTP
ncbi:ribonuclease P protein component [Schaalia sp. Marseille-Q2122]|uniref:ribonuclease P protein component n=1 Tax=Schaalia sp. Marseille-Q2122 TaxID=2736604 RepID=UPI0015889C6F|nr:ribonuclease P protein component [Schaalia sp. Marseille-Q2122]